MAPPPLAQAAVLAPPGVLGGDPLGIADDQRADAPGEGPAHHLLGCLVVGLVHPAAVAGLGGPLGPTQAAPAPRAPLAPPGGPAPHGPGPGGGVGQVQALFGPDRPPRDHQALAGPGHRVWVNDAQVHPGQAGGVKAMVFYRDLGCDIEIETASFIR